MRRTYKEEYQYWLDSPALNESEWEELNSIVFEQSQFPYNVKDYFFNGLIYSNITIHVPQGTVDKYKAHQVWGLIPNITDN